MKIFVSIASYRDRDLANTIKNIYSTAKRPENLFFSIVSHELKNEAIDLSWLDKSQYSYLRFSYKEATGVCAARALANSLLTTEYEYFMQVDSHTRMIRHWDFWQIQHYKLFKKHWGEDYIHSKYPLSFGKNWETGEDVYLEHTNQYRKIVPGWSMNENIYVMHQAPLSDMNGEIVYGFAGNFSFGSTKAMLQIPYDPNLYFLGEEISLGARAYCKGINIVALPINIAFTNYDRDNIRNGHHWEDHENWAAVDQKSRYRLMDLFNLKDLGEYGIEDKDKFDEFQKKAGITLKGRNLVREYSDES